MINEQTIKLLAHNPKVYLRGVDYFKRNVIKVLRYNEENKTFTSLAYGSEPYSLSITFNELGEIIYSNCTCKAFNSYDDHEMCKHLIAMMKTIQRDYSKYIDQPIQLTVKKETEVDSLMSYYNNTLRKNENAILIPTLHVDVESNRYYLTFYIGNDKNYVITDIRKFLEAYHNKQKFEFGKFFSYDPLSTTFNKFSKSILQLMYHVFLDEFYRLGSVNQRIHFDEKMFYLNLTTLDRFLRDTNLYRGRIHLKIGMREYTNVEVRIANFPLEQRIDLENEDATLTFKFTDTIRRIDMKMNYIFLDRVIYINQEDYASYLELLYNQHLKHKNKMVIPKEEIPFLIKNIVPKINESSKVTISERLLERYIDVPLDVNLYLDLDHDVITLQVEFIYENESFNPLMEQTKTMSISNRTIIRDFEKEDEVFESIESLSFKAEDNVFVLKEEDAIYHLLKEGMDTLVRSGNVFYSDRFKNMKIKSKAKITTSIKLDAQSNMFDLELMIGDLEIEDLRQLYETYRLKKKYFRLKDGSFYDLTDHELDDLYELFDSLDVHEDQFLDSQIKIAKSKALAIDEWLEESSFNVVKDMYFNEMLDRFHHYSEEDFTMPSIVNATLRHYQMVGVQWLQMLKNLGFGGILADDMGLGKTLQVITFLCSEKEKNESMRSLVVAPTSLVYNWFEEIKKFAPTLNTLILTGTKEERMKKMESMNQVDLIITSYDVLKRDIDSYTELEFDYCFIDEAQYIKNQDTANAKSVKMIQAKHYFALTGTPIENSLSELWSIFDFTMHGFLNSYSHFQNKYEKPIIREEDSNQLNTLKRLISPFLLRRMKKDVLTELPDKMESVMYNEMDPEQQQTYLSFFIQAQDEFRKELSKDNKERNMIRILSLLTRLRQICNHPKMFIENYDGESAKLNMLLELLQEAKESNHRVLVFSQFTSMLSLIMEQLHSLGISYFYLDGKTKASERVQMCERFNQGENEVFLISLKAGGTGLNLTGADMVIHFDPWWNPAIEEQATDRAYRIGQKNAVQVIKLITKNTIEEKIYELQQRKKLLIDSVIQPGENFISKMSKEELKQLFDL